MTKNVTGVAPSPYEPAAAGSKSRRLLIAIKTKKKRRALRRRLSKAAEGFTTRPLDDN